MATLVGKSITANGLGLESTFAIRDILFSTNGSLGFTKYQDPVPDDVAFAVMKAALASGANVWSGADFYGTEDSNSLHLVNRYFTKYPEDADKVILCIKSGIANMKAFKMDCSPETLLKKVDECNRILNGKKFIDIFGCARVDPDVPIETTIEALNKFVTEGKIGGIQMSEVRADTIIRAAKIAKIDVLEAEVSLWATDIFSNGVAATCGELGIIVLGHSPLGAGMLTGRIQKPEDLEAIDHHRFFPRFQGENFENNLKLVQQLKKFAEVKGCTTAGLALSWIKSFNGRSGMPFILPIAGARSESRVRENCITIKLDDTDLKRVDEILTSFPVAGDRYPAAGMKLAEY
jgi:pyridoxine 4-dehydrogenase